MNVTQLDALADEMYQELGVILAEETRLSKAVEEAKAAGRPGEAVSLDREFWLASGEHKGLLRGLKMLNNARRAAE